MLSSKAEALRKVILENAELTPPEEEVLDQALQALDIADMAQAQLMTEGLTIDIKDQKGDYKQAPHPVAAIGRASRQQFMAGLKQLGLSDPYKGKPRQGRGAQGARTA